MNHLYRDIGGSDSAIMGLDGRHARAGRALGVQPNRQQSFRLIEGQVAIHGYGYASAFPRHQMPGLCLVEAPSIRQRAQGRPGVRHTHGPPANKKQAAVTTGLAATSGLPCTMALRLIRALPGAPGFLATVCDNA